MSELYPLCFKPVYKDYLWGGVRIPERFGRNVPDGIYAESWEISTHPDGPTPVANGPLAGKTLSDLLPEHKTALLGRRARGGNFPLLIKLIDAHDTLSVQVHPNDANAAAVNGDPKTEMWYFLEGGADACVYCGLKPGVGQAELLQALKNKTVAELLRNVPAVPGEAVFVPGGRVHAIGAGCLILEIQQNSNTTYRLYDWDRTGADGKPRELHIEKALQAIDWENESDPRCTPRPFIENSVEGMEIKRSDYFKLDRFELSAPAVFTPGGSTFHALFIAAGKGSLSWTGGSEPLTRGQSWLIPAGLSEYRVDGTLTVLRVTLP
jgi:mannose-6-phosphate isomerase